MSDRIKELGPDTIVALVTFTARANLASYLTAHDLPFVVLSDPDRRSYRAYGLARATLARVWGLRAARRYLEIFRRDGIGRLRKPTEDTRQLGGDFVIAPDGTLAWAFWGAGPDDRPSVDAIVDAVVQSRLRPSPP